MNAQLNPQPMSTASAAGASISLSGLTKSYGGTTVLAGIDLDVAPGEFITFLGPSGSGKTTTLNLIAGFLSADRGSIVMDGRSLGGLPPHKRNIGMVFQNYALFPHMTVAANVAYPLAQRRVPRAVRAARVQEALARVELTGFGSRYPRELSGGQQQRVAIARALIFDPRVVLMDEPLGALDKKLREALQLEIKKIHRELGLTFIYVTHDQEEALILSDRIAVFNNGAIEQVGDAFDVYQNPTSGFVARFIGTTSCFTGRHHNREGTQTVRSDGLDLVGRGTVELTDGETVSLVVRPEHAEILPRGRSPRPGHEVVEGSLEEVIYLGSMQRSVVRLESGATVIVDGTADRTMDIGDQVCVSWSRADALIVPERAAAVRTAEKSARSTSEQQAEPTR